MEFRYATKAIIRCLLYWAFRPLATKHYYDYFETGGRAIGFKGWITLPRIGTIAFVDSDDRIIFYW